MLMYLNKDKTTGVEISSYSRDLDVPNPDVRFSLNLSFSGDYSPEGFEYLADFADNDITDIEITTNDGTTVLETTDVIAKLNNLNETCDDNGKTGFGVITIYEAGVTPSI